MSQPIRFVGLEVHADSITVAVAVAEEGRGEARQFGRYLDGISQSRIRFVGMGGYRRATR
jgi:hypothetical protein